MAPVDPDLKLITGIPDPTDRQFQVLCDPEGFCTGKTPIDLRLPDCLVEFFFFFCFGHDGPLPLEKTNVGFIADRPGDCKLFFIGPAPGLETRLTKWK